MVYKISEICDNLSIGKSTVYKRLEILKKDIPISDLKNNDYYYYDEKNKLFITEKGFEFLKNFKFKNQNVFSKKKFTSDVDISIVYQNQIIDILKQRNEYLESENKRLLDLLTLKEQKEITKDIKSISGNNFFDKLFKIFKK